MAYSHNKAWKKRNPEKVNEMRKKNYKQTNISSNFSARTKWSQIEDRILLNSIISDRLLHYIIGRSVQAIQLRRHKLKYRLVE